MNGIVAAIAQLAVLVFVIGSMLSLGLSLTMQQIIEPLKIPGESPLPCL